MKWLPEAHELAKLCAEETCISTPIIESDSKVTEVAHARFAIFLILRRRGHSYPMIAKMCRKEDHTTIMNGVKVAEASERIQGVAAAVALRSRYVNGGENEQRRREALAKANLELWGHLCKTM